MIPYIIWTPDYQPDSGGVKVLHKLCHALNQRGLEAYLFPTYITNPEWKTPVLNRSNPPEEFIAVYPEIVSGNPMNSICVARWILNVPGRLGGDGVYSDSDLIFPYVRSLNTWGLPEERVLFMPVDETHIYYNMGLERSGRIVYVGKGFASPRIPETKNLFELTRTATKDKEQMALLFNKSELLYSYDNFTAVLDMARLCGCPVVTIPNGERTKKEIEDSETGICGIGFGVEETEYAMESIKSGEFTENYLKHIAAFNLKLDFFINLTQKRFKYNKVMKDL